MNQKDQSDDREKTNDLEQEQADVYPEGPTDPPGDEDRAGDIYTDPEDDS